MNDKKPNLSKKHFVALIKIKSIFTEITGKLNLIRAVMNCFELLHYNIL